jgi:hypothetical protein
MAYGIQIYNDSGFLQIDQDYTNYLLHTSGSVTSTGRAISGSDEEPDVSTVNVSGVSANDDVIFAFRPATADGSAIRAVKTSTTGQFKIYSDYAGTINWKAYKKGSLLSAPTSGYGLNVYRSDGTTLAYSSSFDIMSVATVLNVSHSTPSTSVYNHSFSGLPWAIAGAFGLSAELSFWEDFENGDNLGVAEYAHLAVAWNSSTQLQAIDITTIINGILEPSNIFGVLGQSTKIGILSGYA